MRAMRQSLHTVCYWEKENSNPALHVRADECSRSDNFEFFPVAMALCISWTCIGSFQVLYRTSSLTEFSLGIVGLNEYRFDFSLADCIGKLPMSWGILQNGYDTAKIYSDQAYIKSIPTIKSQDVITIFMDLNEGGNEGLAHFFVNRRHVWTLRNLACEETYAMACTMSPESKVIIQDSFISLAETLAAVDLSVENVESECHRSEVKVYASRNARSSSPIEDKWSLIEQLDILSDRRSPGESKSNVPEDIDSINTNASSIGSATTSSSSLPVPTFFPKKSLLAPKSPKTKEIGEKISAGENAHSLECCVCMTNARCMLFMPCKHLCTCEDCGGDGKTGSSDGAAGVLVYCPMCRLKIKSRMKVFM